jgi:hypothetical protein
MKIPELLKQYRETIDALFTSFGIDNGYGEIDDRTDDYFTLSRDNVAWSSEKFDPEDDAEYANDVRSKRENDTHYLLYVDNGCGDQFYQIFDKSKEIKEEL